MPKITRAGPSYMVAQELGEEGPWRPPKGAGKGSERSPKSGETNSEPNSSDESNRSPAHETESPSEPDHTESSTARSTGGARNRAGSGRAAGKR